MQKAGFGSISGFFSSEIFEIMRCPDAFWSPRNTIQGRRRRKTWQLVPEIVLFRLRRSDYRLRIQHLGLSHATNKIKINAEKNTG